ncbi:MAG TPA: TRAP transporter large permease [Spirochaetales bacterium]|nr:TRAP transporter large permease [Spirochaetales bacterium]HRY54391.1 TRAP transporter large permease [Spirochaetia bacterium]
MTLLALAFVALLLANVPLAFVVGISSMTFFVGNADMSLMVPVTKMIYSAQNFALLAVPFFLLAGNLMTECGITRRLFDFCNISTGHMRGGLAHVNILLSTLMGGISGSAASDAAMDCRMTAPEMIKRGYSKGFTAAVTAYSSLITATIPPGIGLILFGYIGSVSIGRLFVGGIMPGFLMCAIMMLTAWLISARRNYGRSRERRATPREFLKSLVDNIWALLFPVILIVGIRFGFFTPSEAGAFAVAYAVVIGKFVYKELTNDKIVEALRQTVADTGMIMLIIICSAVFGYVIIYNQAPQAIAAFLVTLTENPVALMLIIMAFLVVAGMFMEPTVNTLLLTPIFLPVAKSVGVDPVHFGLVMMTTITMGSFTPPVGVVIYAVCSILECPLKDYLRESLPFLACVLVLIGLMVAFPQIVLFLPNLVYGG